MLFHVERFNKNTIHLRCQDHLVSGEYFDIVKEGNKKYLKTDVLFSQSELNKYYESPDYISHTNHNKSAFSHVYSLIRFFSASLKLKLISKYKSPKARLLDFGAGVGYFVRKAREKGWDSKGIEVNANARSIGNSYLTGSVVPPSYINEIPNHSQSVITLWHVLEHLPNLDDEITQLRRILDQSGRLVVAVPNFKSYDAHYFGEYWAAYDVPRHLWHFSKASIIELFNNHGMEVESVHPLWFDSFYVSLLSTKHKYKSMKIFKGLWVGLISNLKALKSGEYSSLIFVVKHK